jgi:hypothetical protein
VPLSILLLTRPVRVAGVVAAAAAAAILSAAIALRSPELVPAAASVALLATAASLGVLAPLYGRGAAIGLRTARGAIALGAVALLIPDSRPTTALRVAAALLVLAGLQLVARGVRRVGELPAWTCVAVGAGVAAVLLAPGLGGGVVLGLAWLAVAAAIHVTYVAPTAAAPALGPAAR